MPTKTIRKRGTVGAFNISPKGSYEGLLLEGQSEAVQVNFPQELAHSILQAAPIGATVEIQAEPGEARGNAVHDVFQLISLKNSEGKKLPSLNDSDGRFSGTVVRLNYALHGEVNGGILDNGDFLHVKPHGAAALALEAGMKVKGRGTTKPMIDGHRVIEAERVNGISMEKKPKPKKHAQH